MSEYRDGCTEINRRVAVRNFVVATTKDLAQELRRIKGPMTGVSRL